MTRSISIDATIYRRDEPVEVTATGYFHRGDLHDFSVAPPLQLSSDESYAICQQLCCAFADDFDEAR